MIGVRLGVTLGANSPGARYAGRLGVTLDEVQWYEHSLARRLFSWLRADYVDLNGAQTKTAAVNDKVALVSEGAVAPNSRSVDPLHKFSQGTDANQAVAPSLSAALNNRKVINNANPNAGYTSSIANSNWKFHSHSHAIYTAASPQDGWGTLHATMNLGGASNGVYCSLSRTAGAPSQQTALGAIGNGTGTFHVDNTGAVGSAPVGVPRVFAWKYRLNTDHSIVSAIPKTVSVAGSASSSNPANSMILYGGHIFGAVGLLGMWAESMFWNREPSASEDAMVTRYMFLRYGRT